MLYVTQRCIWRSELAEMSAKVQQIREEIRYLRAAVAEKDSIQKQNEELEGELIPVQEKSKRLHRKVNKLCHKLLNEGLEISKKERAYQSSQIAQRIDGISATMVYDPTPAVSPKHSPTHSPKHSPKHSPMHSPPLSTNVSLNGSVRDDVFRHLQRSRLDSSDARSEMSGFSHHSEGFAGGTQGSRAGTGPGAGTLAHTLSSYDELGSAHIDPDMIWKVPAKAAYINAPAAGQKATSGAHRDFIRQRLRELQDLKKTETDTWAEYSSSQAGTAAGAAVVKKDGVKTEAHLRCPFLC
jgi:hypothetical protein